MGVTGGETQRHAGQLNRGPGNGRPGTRAADGGRAYPAVTLLDPTDI
jgi:hypothetical protein